MRTRSFLPLLLALAACPASGGSDDGGNPQDSSAQPSDGVADGAQPSDGVASNDATADASEAGACVACVTGSDCQSTEACTQLAGDTYCATTCTSNAQCDADATCTTLTDYAGNEVSVCVTRANVCGTGPSDSGAAGDTSIVDSAGADAGERCGTYVGPDVPASCKSCSPSSSTCQTNGCYGGWWCETASNRCQAPPTNCTPPPVDAGPGSDTGSPAVDSGSPNGDAGLPVGTVGPDGGTVSRLYFGVVGDTRPATNDDTANYPTAIITKIYDDLATSSPLPTFVVSTGDYCFATSYKTESGPQMDLYMKARAAYAGTWFPAMGNHECTGATASNCGSGAADGLTNNYNAFVSKMLAPIGKTDPYYSIRVDAPDGSWTSKLVFVAGNAWSAAQGTWLDAALAVPTTYTFVVRHEPNEANTAPGVLPSDAIIAKHPLTLKLVGHTHTYERHTSQHEVVIGNGGAPLTSSGNYGYAIVQQRADGTIRVDMIDYQTKAIDTSFAFAVKADGSAAGL